MKMDLLAKLLLNILSTVYCHKNAYFILYLGSADYLNFESSCSILNNQECIFFSKTGNFMILKSRYKNCKQNPHDFKYDVSLVNSNSLIIQLMTFLWESMRGNGE